MNDKHIAMVATIISNGCLSISFLISKFIAMNYVCLGSEADLTLNGKIAVDDATHHFTCETYAVGLTGINRGLALASSDYL